MNAELQALKERRSVRKYKADMVPQELIDQVIDAGLYAASGHGEQDSIIVAVTNKEVRDKLSQMNRAIMGTKSDTFYGAPVVLIVLAPKSNKNAIYDASLIMGNLMQAAHAVGLGSCWIQGRNRVSSTEDSTEDYIRNIFHFPKNLRLEALLSVGHIDQTLPAKEVTEELLNKVHTPKY